MEALPVLDSDHETARMSSGNDESTEEHRTLLRNISERPTLETHLLLKSAPRKQFGTLLVGTTYFPSVSIAWYKAMSPISRSFMTGSSVRSLIE